MTVFVSPLETALEDAAVLLQDRPSAHYASYSHAAPVETLRRFSVERDFAALQRSARAFGAWDDGRLQGLTSWSPLPWDSQQFQLSAGRIDLLVARGANGRARETASVLTDRVVRDCHEKSIRHLTVRVDSGDLASIHALESAGFELLDGIQTFNLRLDPGAIPPPDSAVWTRLFEENDLEQVCAIARSAYSLDRFHADSAISADVADRVNEAWVRNSCLGHAADAVVVAGDADKVLGYVTCKIDPDTCDRLGFLVGTIVMVATAAEARGSGVGRAATYGALRWFARQGVRFVEVGTQLRNTPAARLYLNCGFRPIAVSLTFRKLL